MAKRIQSNSKHETCPNTQEEVPQGVSLLLWNSGTEQQPPTGVSKN